MREVHRELHELKGTANPLRRTGPAHRAALPADLLRRVPRRRRHRRDDPAPAAGGAVRQPREHRHHLQLPPRRAVPERPAPRPHPAGHRAAEAARWRCINVDAGTDYRQRTLEQVELYHTPLGAAADAAMAQAFEQLAEARDEDPVLHIEQRELRARRRAGGVVWFDFAHAVRRAALAERLPGAGHALPHACCCPTCRRCRRGWPARRGASPGWSTCCTTGASS